LTPIRIDARRTWAVDAIAIFLLTVVLVWPLFNVLFQDNWRSIEATFIADGRMLLGNLPHRQWQPLWYCGTRADYVYPPALRYATAILTIVLHTSPARAYHIYTALMYCVGIVGVYTLVRVGTRSRSCAWVGAASAALISPTFLVLADLRHDSLWRVPQRLHVLIRYGEGPHISSLALLPFALAFSLLVYRKWNPAAFAVGGVSCAAVVTHNFYGATALAILFPVLTYAAGIRYGWRSTLVRAAGIIALSYGLTAAWLTPSYLRITAANLSMVAEPGNRASVIVLAAVALVFALAAWLVAKRRTPAPAYEIFVAGAVLFLALDVLGHRFFGFQVAGDTGRLVPELDLAIIIGGVEVLRRLYNWRPRGGLRMLPRLTALLLLIAAFAPALRYVRRGWNEVQFDLHWREQPEYKVSEWMWQNHRDARAFVDGSIRFWYNVWHDLPQLDGGSQQGLLNPLIASAQWRLREDTNAELVKLWLQALATDIAIIPQPSSRERYHDIKQLNLWRSTFPLLHDDGEGNYFYSVPRRCGGVVRLVDSGLMNGLSPIPKESELDALRTYVNAIEAEPLTPGACGRVQARRVSTDEWNIDGDVGPRESLLVQETFDAAWRAYVDGRPAVILRDPVGFMLIPLAAGRHSIRVVFETPFEAKIGYSLSLLSLVVAGALVLHRQKPNAE
jgi:hypothetical protein